MENLEIKVMENLEPLKEEINGLEKVSEEQVASSLDYNKLTTQEQSAIDDFVSKIDEKDKKLIKKRGEKNGN